MKRPSILKQDDLKELDELDHDGDEGWAGQQMLIFRYVNRGSYREPDLIWKWCQMYKNSGS